MRVDVRTAGWLKAPEEVFYGGQADGDAPCIPDVSMRLPHRPPAQRLLIGSGFPIIPPTSAELTDFFFLFMG